MHENNAWMFEVDTGRGLVGATGDCAELNWSWTCMHGVGTVCAVCCVLCAVMRVRKGLM